MFCKKIWTEIDSIKAKEQVDYNAFSEALCKANDRMNDIETQLKVLDDRCNSFNIANFGKSLAELNDKMNDLNKEYNSLRRIIQFYDHDKVTYVNDPSCGCYLYKDGMEYYIDGLNLRGNVLIYGQSDSDFEHIIMATCDIDSNDGEVGHEEQYVIDLNARSFIRTE